MASEAKMQRRPGEQWAYVLYNLPGPPVWHQRCLIGRVVSLGSGRAPTDTWVVATPDADIYEEDLGGTSVDVQAVRYAGVGRAAFPGAAATDLRRRQARGSARDGAPRPRRSLSRCDRLPLLGPAWSFEEAGGRWRRLTTRLPMSSGSPPKGIARTAAPLRTVSHGGRSMAISGSRWSRDGVRRGEAVAVASLAEVRGDRGLVDRGSGRPLAAALVRPEEVEEFKGREAGSDARLTPLVVIGTTREKKQWREAVQAFGAVELGDFAVPGPRTTAWCCSFLDRHSGGPRDHHRWWKANLKLHDDMWGVAEHSLAMQSLDIAACYDGLDVVNFGCIQLLLRKAQMIEDAYAERGPPVIMTDGKKSAEGTKEEKGGGGAKGSGKGQRPGLLEEGMIFLGQHKEFEHLMVAPDLMEWVSREVERDAAVMKQVRKAREERFLARQGR